MTIIQVSVYTINDINENKLYNLYYKLLKTR